MASVFETIKRILFRPIQVRTCFEARTDEFLAAMRAASEYRNSGDTVQASQQCQTMISLLEDITRQCTGIAAQRFVAAGYFDVGSLYREMEHVPEAERCFATAIEKFERLKNNSSQTHFSDSMLAGCQNQLGMLYSDCEPLDKAETALTTQLHDENVSCRKCQMIWRIVSILRGPSAIELMSPASQGSVTLRSRCMISRCRCSIRRFLPAIADVAMQLPVRCRRPWGIHTGF